MRATIKAKLAGTFTLVIALLCLVVGVGLTRVGALNDMILEIVDGPAQRIQLSLTADADIGRAIRAEKNMMLTTDVPEMRDLEAKFDALDTDKDGKLTLTEFTGDRQPAEAARWFERRDVDRDGSVSREEYLPGLPLSKTP